jgi:hypothetical protein
MGMESHGGMILTRENQRTWRKTCPNVPLSIINPTWTNLGLCSERPVANHLGHGMASQNQLVLDVLLPCVTDDREKCVNHVNKTRALYDYEQSTNFNSDTTMFTNKDNSTVILILPQKTLGCSSGETAHLTLTFLFLFSCPTKSKSY